MPPHKTAKQAFAAATEKVGHDAESLVLASKVRRAAIALADGNRDECKFLPDDIRAWMLSMNED